MRVVEFQGVELDVCDSCQSCWLDTGELRLLTQLETDIPGIDYETNVALHLPSCPDVAMEEYQFKVPHNLLLDCCPCNGIYCEAGELDRSLELS